MVYAADEYYLLAERDFPPAERYGDFSMHEDGIGMARAFDMEFSGRAEGIGVQPGFFAWVDGAPATGYRAPRGEPAAAGACGVTHGLPAVDGEAEEPGSATPGATDASPPPGRAVSPRRDPDGHLRRPVALAPLIGRLDRRDVRLVPVENRFFGGNVGVSGLMVGEDISRTLADEPSGTATSCLTSVCPRAASSTV